MTNSFDAYEVDLHGHRAVYRAAGSGPTVVLIHGMVNSSRHWERVALKLAETHHVVAPDLIGHGDAAMPRGDYSLGAHAASIRDLLAAIGVDRATIVGHSLGGGVAMQFFYQFPQRTERLVLISSGGLGQEVSPLLRGAALPGAGVALKLATRRSVVTGIQAAGSRLRAAGRSEGAAFQAVARALRPLESDGSRRAFMETLRAVIDVEGQRVSARDRLYLLGDMQTLIVWGQRDRTIPIEHGIRAAADIPHCRFETLPNAAHFPNIEDPDGLSTVLADFLTTSVPVQIHDHDWGAVLAQRGRRRLRRVA